MGKQVFGVKTRHCWNGSISLLVLPARVDPMQTADLTELFREIVDIESVSGNEARLADEVEAVLRGTVHLEVYRFGNVVIARTNLGRAERVIFAGHLDTVPLANNLPSEFVTDERGLVLRGRGTCDMKGGVAVMLHLAVELLEPNRDVTWVFYDNEEISQEFNGLRIASREHPEFFVGDLAILMEPTAASIEGGCQGTMRFQITTRGRTAHSARSWLGKNAIHDSADVLELVRNFDARQIEVDGLLYHEGLNVTSIHGGIAGNVIPDVCEIQINYRFAPNKTGEQAAELMRESFEPYELEVLDLSDAARPGLNLPAAVEFIRAVGKPAKPKFGWTDVATFSALGIPALNYGPADPSEAHTDLESCPIADLESCAIAIRSWLGGAA